MILASAVRARPTGARRLVFDTRTCGQANNTFRELTMTTGAMIFMLGSWGFVLGLTLWSFRRIMKKEAVADQTVETRAAR